MISEHPNFGSRLDDLRGSDGLRHPWLSPAPENAMVFRTIEVATDVLVDVDKDGNPLGVEYLSDISTLATRMALLLLPVALASIESRRKK